MHRALRGLAVCYAAIAPTAALGLALGDALRKTRWSPGVRATGSYAMGRLPASGTARVLGQEDVQYDVQSDARPLSGLGYGLVLTLSHGL